MISLLKIWIYIYVYAHSIGRTMKKYILILMIGLLSSVVFAAPFGFTMGMTLKEIAKKCEGKVEHLEDDIYLVKPIKSHPSFTQYNVYVDKKKGLYGIKAATPIMKVNPYGTEIKGEFRSMKDRISKTYGEPKTIDKIDPNSIFTDDKYWMYTLNEGARHLVALWKNDSLADNLIYVGLGCIADSPYSAHLLLEYNFKNSQNVEDDQDSVF